jgi:hypothetical protein
MKATAIALLACVLVIAFAVPCFAGHSRSYQTLDGGLKMMLHIQDHNAKQSCSNLPVFASRDDITRMETGTGDYDVFMVIFDYGAGYTNVEYGLSWPAGWGSAATIQCADLNIGGIVNPYDWISLSWITCQTTPAYSPVAWSWINAGTAGQVQIEYRPREANIPAALGTIDCAFAEVPAESIFFAGIDVNPWEGQPDTLAAEPTTWGGIKAMFR